MGRRAKRVGSFAGETRATLFRATKYCGARVIENALLSNLLHRMGLQGVHPRIAMLSLIDGLRIMHALL